MTTKQQALRALGDLRAVIAQAQSTMDEIETYWHEDAEMSRVLSSAGTAFSDAASDVVQRVEEAAEQLDDEHASAKDEVGERDDGGAS